MHRPHQGRAELQAPCRLRRPGAPRRDDAVGGADERPEGRQHSRPAALARALIDDRGYESNPFRAVLVERGIAAYIPPKKNRKQPIPYDKALYRQRHRIEIAFGRLKDWRRIAARYDRCGTTFFGTITLAAIFIFWLRQ